ncbi:MAG: hypothetical protein K2X81_15140 [Candidatus Obscuribacterales bacterium]|nr:hypothetical protein [Candidatus Obscuribacterales bacterium]
MPELDIKELIKDAEEGNGCSIKDKVHDLPFDSVASLMDLVVRKNRDARSEPAGADLPRLNLYQGTLIDGKDFVRIGHPGNHWYTPYQTIFDISRTPESQPGKKDGQEVRKCLNVNTDVRHEDPPKPSDHSFSRQRRESSSTSAADQINLGAGAIPSPSIFVQ